ncbi:MAG: hypothetical protein ACRDQ1_01120 [Sciscionella sp.]
MDHARLAHDWQYAFGFYTGVDEVSRSTEDLIAALKAAGVTEIALTDLSEIVIKLLELQHARETGDRDQLSDAEEAPNAG